MHRTLVSGAIALAIAAIAMPLTAKAQDLRINGSTTVSDALLVPQERQIEAASGVSLEITPTGSGHGIRALVGGGADMAMISAPLGAVVSSINEREPGSVNGRELVAHEIGSTQVAFIVHPSNPVRRLTAHQLYDILAGRITNWREVGGTPMPIQIMVEPPGGGVRSFVEDRISEWGDHLATENFVQSAPLVVMAVSSVPGALGITAIAQVNGSVDLIETEETLAQSVYLVTRGQPDSRMRAVIDASRAEWQRLQGGNS